MLKNIEESRFSPKQKKIITLILLLLVLAFAGAVALVIGKPMIELVKNEAKFRDFVSQYGVFSDIVFILMIVFQIVIAIVPGEPFEIAAGYAFGYIRGTVDCLIGFAIGGAIVFLLVRKFGVKIVEIFFSMDKIKELKFLQNPKRVNVTTFIVFLIPGTPKDLLSYFAGLTDMKLSFWMFITTVARFPSLITSIVLGNAINEENYMFAVIVFAVTLLISGAGLIIYNRIKKKNNS